MKKKLLLVLSALLMPFIGSSMEKSNDDNQASISESDSFLEKKKNLLKEKSTDGEGDESADSSSFSTSTDSSENQESSSSSELLVLTDVKEKEKQKLKLLLQREAFATQEELVLQGLPLGNIFQNKTGKSLFDDHQLKYDPRKIFEPDKIDLTKSNILASYKERKKLKEQSQENPNSSNPSASAKNELLSHNNSQQKKSDNNYETKFLKNFKNANSIKEFNSYSQSVNPGKALLLVQSQSYLQRTGGLTKNQQIFFEETGYKKQKISTLEEVAHKINSTPLGTIRARSTAVERFNTKFNINLSQADLVTINNELVTKVHSHRQLSKLREAGIESPVLTLDANGRPCLDGKFFFAISDKEGFQKNAKLISEPEYYERSASDQFIPLTQAELSKGKQILERIKQNYEYQCLSIIESHLADYSDGLQDTTQIKTTSGYKKLKDINVGDTVTCYDFENHKEVQSKVTYVDRKTQKRHVQLQIDGNTVNVACGHKFYVESQDRWVKAKDLVHDECLRRLVNPNITSAQQVEKKLDLVRICVDDKHNFYITDSDILVHNFAPALIFQAAVAFEIGEGIAITWSVVGPTLIAATNGLLFWFGKKIVEQDNYNNPAKWQIASAEIAKAATENETRSYRQKDKKKEPKEKPSDSGSSQKNGSNKNNNKNNTEPKNKGRRLPPPINSQKSKDDEEERKFAAAPYHHKNSQGSKSAGPKNGQAALDNSIEYKTKGNNETQRRLGISDGEIVVFDETYKGTFHGHVRTWDQLKQPMKNALIKAKLVDLKGTIL